MERSHHLKTHESVFLAIRSGAKKAEFRRNDRDFMEGDIVYLERYRPGYHSPSVGDGGAYLDRHGRNSSDIDTIRARITHLQTGFGIPDGFCMFSFEEVELSTLEARVSP